MQRSYFLQEAGSIQANHFVGAPEGLRPVILTFQGTLRVLQDFARYWTNPRQVLSLSAQVTGLAAVVVGHDHGRREMKCPTKVLKDLTR